MNAEQAKAVAKWLNDMGPDKCRDAVPVKLTFTVPSRTKGGKGKEVTFYGARYIWVGQYTAGMMACTHGEKKPGDEYTKDTIYVVGVKPAFPQKNAPGGLENKHVYNIAGDDGDWYAGGGYTGNKDDMICHIDDAELKRMNPFGPWWSFDRWDHEKLGERIDKYDAKKRERLPLTVENV